MATSGNEASDDRHPDPNYQRAGVFRFLDLPGELRNDIYDYAIEHTYRCFPFTWPRMTTTRYASSISRTAQGPCHTRARRINPARPIPYLPLTQVCFAIRKEFRPHFLSTHRFPLFALEGYLKAFYPAQPRGKDARERFEECMDPEGTLRIYAGRDGVDSSDILRLLKHHMRFPEFNITPIPAPHFTDDVTIMALKALITNSNPVWCQKIRGHVVKQVRVGVEHSQYDGWLHIVVKEQWAEDWMKVPGQGNELPRMRKKLGLEEVPWRLTFGVDYS